MKAFVYTKYGSPDVLQLTTLQTIAPNFGAGVLELLQAPPPVPTQPILTALLNEIITMNAQINQKDLNILKELIEAGKLKPVISKCYPFNEIPEAIRFLEQGHPQGKVVITMN
ncbi:MAG: hypothetical protein DWQ04_34840 [Chloroflexi bacterium]|nr:MAG: hypothetical protein DWQ04_34840 [Chloroflexota bacterium]